MKFTNSSGKIFNSTTLSYFQPKGNSRCRNVLETLAYVPPSPPHPPPTPMCCVQVPIQLHTWRHNRSVIHDQVVF